MGVVLPECLDQTLLPAGLEDRDCDRHLQAIKLAYKQSTLQEPPANNKHIINNNNNNKQQQQRQTTTTTNKNRPDVRDGGFGDLLNESGWSYGQQDLERSHSGHVAHPRSMLQ